MSGVKHEKQVGGLSVTTYHNNNAYIENGKGEYIHLTETCVMSLIDALREGQEAVPPLRLKCSSGTGDAINAKAKGVCVGIDITRKSMGGQPIYMRKEGAQQLVEFLQAFIDSQE